MKRARPDLQGWDFASHIRAAAREIMAEGEHAALKRQIAARQHVYEQKLELLCIVHQERSNPPVWRIETIQPGPGDMGIVMARDESERFLVPELRNVLAGKLKTHGIVSTAEEARKLACKYDIRVADTIRLRDADRFAGERS